MKKSEYLQKLEEEYNNKQKAWKDHIREEPSKFKRFWKWVWYLIAFPFVWLFYNVRDWRSAICIIISFLIWSASVWGFYLAALLCGWTTDAAKWLIGIGSAVWVWWASPIGSPFILCVTFTAIGFKTILNKIQNKSNKEKT